MTSVQQMKEAPVLRLAYYFSAEQPIRDECNAGIEEVRSLLDRVQGLRVSVESVDTSGSSEEEMAGAYASAVVPAVHRHSKEYSVRRAFGTRKRGGIFFGRGVPALLIYRAGGEIPVDVFPHYEGTRAVTIRDFLLRLLKNPGEVMRPTTGLTPGTVASLRRLRRRLFGTSGVPGDSTVLIREAREGG